MSDFDKMIIDLEERRKTMKKKGNNTKNQKSKMQCIGGLSVVKLNQNSSPDPMLEEFLKSFGEALEESNFIYNENLSEGMNFCKADNFENVMSNVHHPDHYNSGAIETIDYLESTLSKEEFAGFCKGNVLKYVSREKHKNGIEDLEKASWYLSTLIETLKSNQ